MDPSISLIVNDSVLTRAEAFQIDPALALFQDERIPEVFARCAQIALPEAHVVVKQLRVICSLRRGNDKGNAEKRYDPVAVSAPRFAASGSGFLRIRIPWPKRRRAVRKNKSTGIRAGPVPSQYLHSNRASAQGAGRPPPHPESGWPPAKASRSTARCMHRDFPEPGRNAHLKQQSGTVRAAAAAEALHSIRRSPRLENRPDGRSSQTARPDRRRQYSRPSPARNCPDASLRPTRWSNHYYSNARPE